MQLIITIIGSVQSNYLAEIFPALRDAKCNIVEIRSSRLTQSIASYLLVQGNWNQIAKFESALELIQKRLDIKVETQRPESKEVDMEYMPYTLETISLDKDNIIEAVSAFLFDRGVAIEEITGSSYQAPYIQSSVFSCKMVILIPPDLQLLSLREEFMDFCDHLNIDAILEPIKR